MPKAPLPPPLTARLQMLQAVLDQAGDGVDLALRERDVRRIDLVFKQIDIAAGYVAELRKASL